MVGITSCNEIINRSQNNYSWVHAGIELVPEQFEMLAFAAVSLLVSLVQSQEAAVYIGTGVNDSSLENSTTNDLLLLGGLFPIHADENDGCGGILDFGFQRLEAMVLATSNINKDPSILPGVTLGFEIRDTCTRTNEALEQGLKYVSARDLRIGKNETVLGISGVVGAAYSRVSTSIARLLRLFRVPQISYASTANVLSDKTIFNYFLRTIPPDSLQARAMADIIEYFNWTYVIAMHTGDIYGREGIKAFVNELKKRNSTQRCIATSSIEIPQGAQMEEFEGVVKEINREWIRNATVIVLFGQRDTAIGILRAFAQKQRMDPEFRSKRFTWIGSDGWGDMIPPELYEIAQGSLSVIPRSNLSSEFDSYFQSLHPCNYTANPWFREYWESVFNCSMASQPGDEACNTADQTLSPQSGYKQNSKVSFTMDAVYTFAHAIHKLQQDHCSPPSGLCPEILDTQVGHVSIQGEMLLRYLKNVSFGGVSTEMISFDDNGDQKGGYVVKNLQLQNSSAGEFVFDIIGHWDEAPIDRSESLDIFGEIQWSHSQGSEVPESLCSYPCGGGEYPEPIADQAECCWICKSCPGTHDVSKGLECVKCERGYIPNESRTECVLILPSYLTWSHGWSIVTIILALCGIIATIAVAVVFVVFHKHQLVKASSRELSAVLLIGIMLCYLLPFFFIAKPAPWICAVRRFGIGFCFSLCYSALLVKTNRIHRIFNRPSSSSQVPPLISPESQLFFTALLVAVQIVVAIVWLVVEKPSIEYVYGDYVTDLRCGESPHIGLSVSLGYNFLLLMATLYFAFRTRKIPQNFNETKFINLTMYTLCVLWLAFIPTYYATANLGTIYQTGSLVLAIILNATVTLCILFVPKVYFIFARKETEHFTQSSNYTTTKRISSIDKKLSTFPSLHLPAPGGDSGKSANTSVPIPQHNAVGLTKGNYSNTGSMDVERPHALDVVQQLVDASTQTDMFAPC